MDNPRRRRSRVLPAAAVVAGTALLSGCSAEQVGRGFLPGYADGEVTNMTERVTTLWTGSWVAALAVGLVVWGLVLWCVTVYRKRKDDDVLPVRLSAAELAGVLALPDLPDVVRTLLAGGAIS